jgi:hypothetical protein
MVKMSRYLDRFLHPDNKIYRPGFAERVEALEERIGVRLPADYRHFVLHVGGCSLQDVIVPCTVPTPFGEHILTVLHTVDEVNGLLHSGVAPRNMVCVGYGHFGMTTCLSIAGVDHGHVYSLDTEMNGTAGQFCCWQRAPRTPTRIRAN